MKPQKQPPTIAFVYQHLHRPHIHRHLYIGDSGKHNFMARSKAKDFHHAITSLNDFPMWVGTTVHFFGHAQDEPKQFQHITPTLHVVNQSASITDGVCQVSHVVFLPVHHIIHAAVDPDKPQVRRALKIGTGTAIMVAGVVMATHPVEIIPRLLWDTLTCTVQGYGSMPIVRLFCKKLDMDSLD